MATSGKIWNSIVILGRCVENPTDKWSLVKREDVLYLRQDRGLRKTHFNLRECSGVHRLFDARNSVKTFLEVVEALTQDLPFAFDPQIIHVSNALREPLIRMVLSKRYLAPNEVQSLARTAIREYSEWENLIAILLPFCESIQRLRQLAVSRDKRNIVRIIDNFINTVSRYDTGFYGPE